MFAIEKKWEPLVHLNLLVLGSTLKHPRYLTMTLLFSTPQSKTNTTLSPTIVASRLAFNYLLKNASNGDSPYKISLPISVFSILIPNFSTRTWQDKGVCYVSDFYSNNLLRPFTSLENSYPLTQKDYYLYIRLTHFLLRNTQIQIEVHPLIWRYLPHPTQQKRASHFFTTY